MASEACPADRPAPKIGYDDRTYIQVGSVGTLIRYLLDAEKAAELEGQKHLGFWNASPLASIEIALQRCADGELALQITGLS